MSKDFKENYIRQQQQQAAERKARLEKIGMGISSNAASEDKPISVDRARTSSSATRVTASAVSQNNSGNARRNVDPVPEYVKRRVPVDQADEGVKVFKSSQTAPRSSAKSNTISVSPVYKEKVYSESDKAFYKTGDAVTQQYTLSEIRAASRHDSAESEGVKIYAPPKNETNIKSANIQTIRKTDSSTVKTQPVTQKLNTVAGAVKSNRASVSYGGNPLQNQRRSNRAPSDDEIFKKTLSDSESRAMMFSLTGKAEHPDDGGDVDIINLGMIRAPRKKKEEEQKKKSNIGKYIGRFFITVLSLVLFIVIAVFSTVGIIAHGPSETLRDLLVNSAMQASATKWVPYIFLSDEQVEAILNKSEETVEDKVAIEDLESNENIITEDEWANAKDGMIFETVNGSTFKAYVLLVKDPSRVFVGTSTDNFANAKSGIDVFQAAKRYDSVACINGGEFLDNGGFGTGSKPMGLTYSQGRCVHDDGRKKTFIGFTYENELIVREEMTKTEAESLGIRDAVSFQNGNTLIQRDGDEVIVHYQDGNTGTAQRTGIGQRKDGTVILIVTDGRSASSLGATHNDMIDLMISYGAVSAGLVDGGSSSLMYYEDYYNKYDYDTSKLDKYQIQGLVNNYKAFTEPRKIPTFFMVEPLKEGE